MSKSKLTNKAEINYGRLDKARELLHEIELAHERGEPWVAIDYAPAVAVYILRRLKMITVIAFNDGKHYAQMVDAV